MEHRLALTAILRQRNFQITKDVDHNRGAVDTSVATECPVNMPTVYHVACREV